MSHNFISLQVSYLQTGGHIIAIFPSSNLAMKKTVITIFFCQICFVLSLDYFDVNQVNNLQEDVLSTFQNVNQSVFGQFNRSYSDLNQFSDQTNEAANETLEAIQEWLKEK